MADHPVLRRVQHSEGKPVAAFPATILTGQPEDGLLVISRAAPALRPRNGHVRVRPETGGRVLAGHRRLQVGHVRGEPGPHAKRRPVSVSGSFQHDSHALHPALGTS